MRKLAKLPEGFDSLKVDQEVALEIFDPPSNCRKFWRVKRVGQIVVRHWGRHGTKGQTMIEDASTAWSARDVYESLVREKRNKGYVNEAGVIEKIIRET